jgi:hypothetical protein
MFRRRDWGHPHARWARAAAMAVVIVLVVSVFAIGRVAAAGGRVTRISAGEGFTCAVVTDGPRIPGRVPSGGVWCWGDNAHGQLGDGTTTEHHEPVRVSRFDGGILDDVIGVDAGEAHACAVTAAGTAWCWGWNDFGQLGDGTTTERHGAIPMTRTGGRLVVEAKEVAAGDAATCVRWGPDHAACAGWPSGDGTRRPQVRVVPVQVKGGGPLKGVGSVSADDHACSAGGWCWGDNRFGSLGDGTRRDRWSAVRVTKAGGGALNRLSSIDAGSTHTCAARYDGPAWCWGDNARGAIGDGTSRDRLRAVRVRTARGGYLAGVRDVDVGARHSCARLTSQLVSCWGDNEFGSLGDGTRRDRSTATQVRLADGPFDRVQAISAGADQTCAIRLGGTAWCWGLNDHGQLGDGSITDHLRPMAVVAAWKTP